MQLPIAVASTACYVMLRPGVIEPALALLIAAGLTPCCALGAIIAHRVPAATLKLVVPASQTPAQLLS
eukprot:COSAG01_NODE_6766_length_3508_cov_6.329715_4_plen_68_part_00